MADVSIGMVTYNRLNLTKETFERALKHTGKRYDLVVCDNASTDGTIEWLNELNISKVIPECDSITIVPLNKNHGVAYGRNICLSKMRPETKYICTLDNDVAIPNTNWLKDCCDVLDANDKYGICAVNYECGKSFPSTTIKLLDGRTMQVRIIINTPGTATLLFRKDIFDKIGFFKRYGNGTSWYGHEDASYSLRTKCLGKILFYLNDNGIHLGEGENDVGTYREMKTEQFNKYRPEFVKDLHEHYVGKGLYVDFKEESDE